MALPTAASVVSSGLAAFPSVYYDRAAVATLRPNLALYPALDLKTMPDRSGVVMQIFDHSKMGSNTTPVTEGTPNLAGQAVVQNTRQLSLVQYADYISISDKVAKTQLIDQGKANAELLGFRGALSVDNLVAAVIEAAATSDSTTNIDIATGSRVTPSKIRQAVFGLHAVDTPAKANGLYYGVTHSLIAFDLLNDSTVGSLQDVWKYTDATKALANNITHEFSGTPNRVATIAGCELFESNNVPSYSNWQSGGHTAYATYVVGKNAIFGASLGKTQLGEKNFGVEMRNYDQGNALDPAGLIKSAVVYNFFFGAAVRPGSVNGFRRLRAESSLS